MSSQQKNNSSNYVSRVISLLKSRLHVRTDRELSNALGYKTPATVSQWRLRNRINVDAVISQAQKKGIILEPEIFYEDYRKTQPVIKEPQVSYDQLDPEPRTLREHFVAAMALIKRYERLEERYFSNVEEMEDLLRSIAQDKQPEKESTRRRLRPDRSVHR